jgi:cell division protease FtsH
MATGERTTFGRRRVAEQSALAREWRRLGRAATFVAVLTSPATFAWLYGANDWPLLWAILGTFVLVISFRGFVDVAAHKLIPRASLYGAGHELMEADIIAQRRVWYWRTKFRRLFWLVLIVGGSLALLYGLGGTPGDVVDAIPQFAIYFLSFGLQLPLFFLMNLLILFGPMLFFGLRQMKGYEPGDADWGVKLEDVRGQAEPKAEVTKVIELWSAGEEFRKAGGKP